jgi:deoxycytidylate deaminase
MCAKRLINLGNVRTVYYAMDYRKRDAIDLFARAGINISPMKG